MIENEYSKVNLSKKRPLLEQIKSLDLVTSLD